MWAAPRFIQSGVLSPLHSSIKRRSSCLSPSHISFVALGSPRPLREWGPGACSVALWSLVLLTSHQTHLSDAFHSEALFTQFLAPASDRTDMGSDAVRATPVKSNAIRLCSPATNTLQMFLKTTFAQTASEACDRFWGHTVKQPSSESSSSPICLHIIYTNNCQTPYFRSAELLNDDFFKSAVLYLALLPYSDALSSTFLTPGLTDTKRDGKMSKAAEIWTPLSVEI